MVNAMAALMMAGVTSAGAAAPSAPAGLDVAALTAAGVDPNSMATLLALYGMQGTEAEPPAKKRKSGPPAEAKPGDWMCAYCDSLNYCMDKVCHKCNAANTNATRVGMRAGDWICPNCGDLVFSNNHNCRKCKTRRP